MPPQRNIPRRSADSPLKRAISYARGWDQGSWDRGGRWDRGGQADTRRDRGYTTMDTRLPEWEPRRFGNEPVPPGMRMLGRDVVQHGQQLARLSVHNTSAIDTSIITAI